jgi:hypothetical protein
MITALPAASASCTNDICTFKQTRNKVKSPLTTTQHNKKKQQQQNNNKLSYRIHILFLFTSLVSNQLLFFHRLRAASLVALRFAK